jgi:hypothetical protein
MVWTLEIPFKKGFYCINKYISEGITVFFNSIEYILTTVTNSYVKKTVCPFINSEDITTKCRSKISSTKHSKFQKYFQIPPPNVKEAVFMFQKVLYIT